MSEATALTIAAVIAVPLVLPFVLERLSKLKLGEILEVDLLEVSKKVEENLALELASFEVQIETLGLGEVPELGAPKSDWILEIEHPLVKALEKARAVDIMGVNLGTGDSWLSSRLFLLAALVEDYTSIRHMIFLEDRLGQDRIFVGSATPTSVRQGLAWNSPKFKEAYDVAKRETAKIPIDDTPERKAAWIIQNFASNLDAQVEEEGLQEWVTTQFLDRTVIINKYCIEWNSGQPSTLLIHQILDRLEPYVFLVRSNGQMNLMIDRSQLAERIAKDSLRQLLE